MEPQLKAIWDVIDKKVSAWESLMSPMCDLVNEYIQLVGSTSEQFNENMVQPLHKFEVIVQQYIDKLRADTIEIQNTNDLVKKEKYLSLLKEYSQEEANKIEDYITEIMEKDSKAIRKISTICHMIFEL